MFKNATRATNQGARYASTWANVTQGPADPILGLSQQFQADTFPQKVNLGVGAYRDDSGKPFVLQCVRAAEAKIAGQMDMEYAGIVGVPTFTKAAQKLLLGEDSAAIAANRVVSSQTLSGTGSLRVAAEFLAKWYPGPKNILMPSPTWANHGAIMKDAGLTSSSYRYYRPSDYGLDKAGMLEDLKAAPEGSVVLLHACAHNPTGVDPTQEDWKEIAAVMKAKKHFAWFDSAYQGFATGDIDADAWAVRYFVDQGFDILACQSFAKNMGLYGQRVGAIHVVCADEAEAKRLDSQLKILIRPMYSNPPIHGARLVAEVLGDKELTKLWYSEVKLMADRIITMRHSMVKELAAAGSVRNWDHVIKQIGMFSFTGLTKEQVDKMIKEHHIYLTGNGRVSMAGLTSKNIAYVAGAMHAVTK